MIYEKTVLITGGMGFIGSALLRRLVPKYPNYLFINVDDLRAGSNLKSVEAIKDLPNYKFLELSLERENTFIELMKYDVTDIIHLAAETDVDRSVKNPEGTVQNNVLSTLKLLEFTRKQKNFNKFVYVSTDEVYGQVSLKDASKHESDPQRPGNPYSASKAGAESIVRAYTKTYGLDAVITRGANTFGKFQDYTKLIPVAMKALREGRKIPLYGNGKQMREWLPVDMHASAIEKVWLTSIGDIYNISTCVSFMNLDIVKILIDAVGAPLDSYEFVADRQGHDLCYKIMNERTRALGWPENPEDLTTQSVIDKLKETAKWYYNIKK